MLFCSSPLQSLRAEVVSLTQQLHTDSDAERRYKLESCRRDLYTAVAAALTDHEEKVCSNVECDAFKHCFLILVCVVSF